MGAAPAAPMLGILVSCAIEVIFTFTWSVYIALRCLSKRLLFEVPWFARVSELAARMRSDEATTLSTELGILGVLFEKAKPLVSNKALFHNPVPSTPHARIRTLNGTVNE
jgi:hypothetical protein